MFITRPYRIARQPTACDVRVRIVTGHRTICYMEIIGEEAHRLLAYAEAVTRQGHRLTVKEFEAYASGWDQKVSFVGGGSDFAAAISGVARAASLAMWGDGRREVESMTSYMCRLMWLTKRGGEIAITPLGKALLREANSPLPPSDVGSTLEVVIDPENPFAYAQLVARISGFNDCLIVDPYLDLEQLMTLSTVPSVTRILTGNKDSKNKSPVFAVALGAAPHLELRMADQKLLHDRIVVPSEGSALMLGSSLNSITRRFGVATPLEETSTRLIRVEYDKIWAAAKVVQKATGEPKPDATNSEG